MVREWIIHGFQNMQNTVKYWNISQHHSFWRGYIISAKNEAYATTFEISKKYADQLSGIWNWFKAHYKADEGIPIIIHPSNKLAEDAFCVDGAMALKPHGLKMLVSKIRDFTITLASKSPDSWDISDVMTLVHKYNLDPKSIKEKYFSKIEKNK